MRATVLGTFGVAFVIALTVSTVFGVIPFGKTEVFFVGRAKEEVKLQSRYGYGLFIQFCDWNNEVTRIQQEEKQ